MLGVLMASGITTIDAIMSVVLLNVIVLNAGMLSVILALY
jgi:hypothetical protein